MATTQATEFRWREVHTKRRENDGEPYRYALTDGKLRLAVMDYVPRKGWKVTYSRNGVSVTEGPMEFNDAQAAARANCWPS